MKFNKIKHKGKVYPSPSSPSSTNNKNDPISSLNHVLPSVVLTLMSLLSCQDREVLAYMITHSLESSSSSTSRDPKKNHQKLPTTSRTTTRNAHISPTFDCCCFVCFSSYWNRWNSSPHIELIDQAIEAFEEHLYKTEKYKKHNNKNKRRDKRSVVATNVEKRENEKKLILSREKMILSDAEDKKNLVFSMVGKVEERKIGTHQQHKVLARKVLPDFIAFFQSCLWNRLWRLNV